MLEVKVRKILRYADITKVWLDINDIRFERKLSNITKTEEDFPARKLILSKEFEYRGNIANTRDERNKCLRSFLYKLVGDYASKRGEELIDIQKNDKGYYLNVPNYEKISI